jgi:Asp-tRNA(Asn)/Glu-tRNA(Gln) amidotransferase A subunit family amidase
MTYDNQDVKAPRVTGHLLRAVVAALEAPLSGPALARQLLDTVGVIKLRGVVTDEPLPIHPPDPSAPAPVAETDLVSMLEVVAAAPEVAPTPFIERAADFVAAYLEGDLTPSRVAERVIDSTRASDRLAPPLRIFIAQNTKDLLNQARASTERYRRGEPLGPLDGVPIAVKDEIDQRPYPTTVGTKFLGREPARSDAEAVARLRAAGALLIGKTNMQEIGIGVTGINPHHGTARNPFDPSRVTGGSSSGSAAAVAAGLCPIGVGADGGGSIRIPASFCGQLGLKPTYGRVSEHGAAPLCRSLAHVGPIAATVSDLALAYAVMAGPDEKDPGSLSQPPPSLDRLWDGDLTGVRLGIYRPWFEHADGVVIRRCDEAVGALREAGAEVRPVEIPNLDQARTIHLVTIVSEMAASQLIEYESHRADYGLETRLNLALARNLRAYDYVHAQRLRARMCRDLHRALEQVDVIVTPTVPITAPPIRPDALPEGQSDLELTIRIMRYVALANLSGHPALSCPVGFDSTGLPVGLQLLGRPWGEALLLRLAAVLERSLDRRSPRVRYRLLDRPPAAPPEGGV